MPNMNEQKIRFPDTKHKKTIRKVMAFSVLTLLFSAFAIGETIYKWRDEQGKLHFGDSPPENVTVEIVNTGKASIYRQEGLNQQIPEVSPSQTKTLKREEKKSESARCISAKKWAENVRSQLRQPHSAKRGDDLKAKLRAVNTAVRESC